MCGRGVWTRLSADPDPQIFLLTWTVRGESVDLPNKHICGCGPSADLKPQVLFARPTSNGSANVPVLSNLRIGPYIDTAVGYVRKPVWLCGALGIVYWIQCNPTLLADADGPRTWVAITVSDADHPRTWCLRTRIIRGREISGSAHLWCVAIRPTTSNSSQKYSNTKYETKQTGENAECQVHVQNGRWTRGKSKAKHPHNTASYAHYSWSISGNCNANENTCTAAAAALVQSSNYIKKMQIEINLPFYVVYFQKMYKMTETFSSQQFRS